MGRTGLTDEELERYSRQIALNYIGYEGQSLLRAGRVCLVGAGGLGSPIALKMVAMGIGYLRIIDRDIVSKSDLHRQYLYDESCIGVPKVEAAAKRLSILNSSVKVDPIATSITSRNVEELIEGVDLVIDGLDTIEARYILNRAAVKLKVPYIFGAAIQTFGNISTFIPGETACLECFYSGLRDEDMERCAIVGVFTPLLDIISSIEVSEAIRILLNKETHLKNRLMFVDLENFCFDVVELSRNINCPTCGEARIETSQVLEKAVSGICGRDGRGVFIVDTRVKVLDIESIKNELLAEGITLKTEGTMGLTFDYSKEVGVSVLKGGVAILQVAPGSGIYDEEAALSAYRKIAERLGLPMV
ncbi:MAG: HesA/MoeB/ThiF family protein [Candidatus Methylarchaceae archaeon HK02M1]|nr:HesA/MoeB/ThiF family protein [Candidatus Methylarchaceae archaeon HK02M1]